jgi:hypothetical protein
MANATLLDEQPPRKKEEGWVLASDLNSKL